MKKRNIKILVIVIAVTIGIVLFFNNYIYQDARDIATEKAVYTISAQELIADYENDMQAADVKYLNKTIVVEGKITKVVDSLITINSTIFCTFNNDNQLISVDEVLSVKGRCIGYDELFGEVKLDQCSIKE
ncbi:MAG: hypothetical protein BM557_08390 [Flavobacterium sp. MedPE-SWcel]|uniref:OB-fold protein n=1 Tax=uncultured Flavobacterium sp. TaxID=165435 RepID=UPI00091BF3F9|nr:hypothetical protein [uncultured Flavobacterium sp.]OIQ17708.1 MAG: hypothetical protein BM557_08390 [Flavobacterium sp. MedPE-SWcel]